ncbi:zinc finger protein 664-like isoform X1 [Periplaneta americana]|uniref:zinc finger protein 664-like isoform X1 n=1 Tax=Periplaneta americana TaxID=6978 RepID=UPI0037E8D856
MDVIKTESEVNPLAMEEEENCKIDVDEKKPLSQEGNSLDLQVTEIKTECLDHGYDENVEMKYEETPLPVNISVMKCEVEESSLSPQGKTEIRTECKDYSHVPTPEMTAVNVSSVKSETEEEYYLETGEEKIKQEVTVEGEGVLTDSMQYDSESHAKHMILEESVKNRVYPIEYCESSLADHSCGDLYSRGDETKVGVHSHKADDSVCSDSGDISLKCNLCGRVLTTPKSLAKHLRKHSCAKSFKCDVCGKCFPSMAKVTIHLRSHTGEKPYMCDECKKCFSTKSILKNHMLVHTGEMSFKCDICGKCFSLMQTLQRHERYHKGVKLFQCDICEKRYAKKASLVVHARQHTEEWQ